MRRIKNPFLVGRPVPPERFIGRSDQLDTVLGRLDNSDSSLLVGAPQIGKSSFKRLLVESQTAAPHLEPSEHWIFVDLDCHLLPSTHEISDVWRTVLQRVIPRLPAGTLRARFERYDTGHFQPYVLNDLFTRLGRGGRQVVLVLDEFDSLLHLPKLATRDLFGPLRTIANNTEGLAVVAASRVPLSELNARTSAINGGSPFFNNHTDVHLPALSLDEVDLLLDRGLDGTRVSFDLADRLFVERAAGRHPYLVQAAAHALFAVAARGIGGPERYTTAEEALRGSIASHFADLWRLLPAEQQLVATVLALAEVRGQAQGRDFDTHDIADLDRFRPELDALTARGLVELHEATPRWRWDPGSHAIWCGERWRIAADAFGDWILRTVIAQSRDRVDFDAWLRSREHDGLLTGEEKEQLRRLRDAVPTGVAEGLGGLVRGAVAGLLGKPTG
ncbi:MAG: hypothetical protein AAGC60_17015 [Acidobacteriota bacterium]